MSCYIYQHCFEENYRNAHDDVFIRTASPKQLALVIHELNNEFLDIAKKVINEEIAEPIRKFQVYSELLENGLSDESFSKMQTLHLQVALCTGSLLEGLLQLFLLAYNHDYLKAHWKKWEDIDVDVLCESIKQHLTDLVNNKVINSNQKSSILNLVKCDLKTRKDGKEIKRIMLDELIGFCKNQNIFREEPMQNASTEKTGEIYRQMECIRDCRNNIHIFANQSIPTLEIVLSNVRSYCLIACDIIIRVQGLMEY